MHKLPSPTAESRALAAELDKMASEYAAILGENYRERKAKYFEKCRALASTLYEQNRVIIYAGDCDFDTLHDSIGEDNKHLVAIIIFCTDSENFYIMGVCIKSTSLFKRYDTEKDDLDALASDRWGKLGVYFEG